MSDNIEHIGEYAFAFCKNLETFTVPKQCTKIENGTFSGCEKLNKISIPGNVTAIEAYAFKNCPITDVFFDGSETQWKKMNINDHEDGNKSLKNATMHFNSVENFSDTTTENDNTKTHDKDTTSVKYKGSCGDNVSYELHSNGVLYIYGTGDMKEYSDFEQPFFQIDTLSYFSYNVKITELVIEPGVTSIGKNSFNSCINITSVTIPDSITKICESAFYNCSGLTVLNIPESVSKIEDKAFYRCDNITDIYFDGTEEEWLNATSENNDESLSTAMKHYKDSGDITYTPDYESDNYQPITIYDSTEKNSGNNSYQGIKYNFYNDYAEITGVDDELYSSYNSDYANSKVFAFPKEIVFTKTSKVLPITTISGNYSNLTAKKVIIPKSVKKLTARFGDEFSNNKALREFVFEGESQISSIPSYAFSYCTSTIHNLR